MVKILLLRHGQSEWNVLGRWQGSQGDPELTEAGRRQAKESVQNLSEISKVYSSPLKRALETAQIISDDLNLNEPILEPRLVEKNVGEWSGLTTDEIESKWPDYIATGKRPDSFETNEDLVDRGVKALIKIAKDSPNDTVCAVAHGGITGKLAEHANRFDNDIELVRLRNCQGWWIEVDLETEELKLLGFFENNQSGFIDNFIL